MHLHPNTFRYRMRIIKEISNFDPQDPGMRFLAEPQLRLLELN
ncbi:helix-turn-helix domain-containing protein [Streptomyces sp. NPDC059373]